MGDMRWQKFTLIGLLAGLGVYFALVYLPAVTRTQVIGIQGDWLDGRFMVSGVLSGSPADSAGVRPGDIVAGIAGRSALQWRNDYESDFGVYLAKRHQWRGRTVDIEIARPEENVHRTLAPRPISFAEALQNYGIRTGFVLFIAALTVLIVLSNPRERSAFIVCLSFFFYALWLLSGSRHWPSFFSPLIPNTSGAFYSINEIVQIVALQLTVSCLVHVAMVFPERRNLIVRHHWILASVYVIPFVILGGFMAMAQGSLAQQMVAAYQPRLWLNTALPLLSAMLMLDSYRRCRSPAQRERTRWVVVSIAIAAFSSMALWSVPKMVWGAPLIGDYDWLLLPFALVPLAVTLGISNHRLFGVRGIISTRLSLLEAHLNREKKNALKWSQRFDDLDQEIHQLKVELDEYNAAENLRSESPGEATSMLRQLQERYPSLAQIRSERLIGESPQWVKVFEDAALAAQGTTPVIIVGESGTGKSDLAWTIYQISERAGNVYREISCAQFGHADPAFALGKLFGLAPGHGLPNVDKAGHRGLLDECDGGTLFLDDFDRLPLNVQDLFLYPLEGKPFEPGIGTGPSRRVSIKFIFATNRDPDTLVAAGLLRQDVLMRIGARVDLPPLRDRRDDIPLLVDHFLRQVADDLKPLAVTPKTLHLLGKYSYNAGNVRELKMEVERAASRAALGDDHVLRAGYLSAELRSNTPDLAMDTFQEEGRRATGLTLEDEARSGSGISISRELAVLRKHRFQIKESEFELGLSHKSKTLTNHLRGLCLKALSDNDWDMALATKYLVPPNDPITSAKLERKMERYLSNVRSNVREGNEKRLYNNLPSAFHQALGKTITWTRSQIASKRPM